MTGLLYDRRACVVRSQVSVIIGPWMDGSTDPPSTPWPTATDTGRCLDLCTCAGDRWR